MVILPRKLTNASAEVSKNKNNTRHINKYYILHMSHIQRVNQKAYFVIPDTNLSAVKVQQYNASTKKLRLTELAS